jgi:BirA family biotin operon repressor/biotin-[acetyl-CoA-carboxylase] ligase
VCPDPIPDELAEALRRVQRQLGPLASSVRYFATIGSTNDEAAAHAAARDAEGLVVIADAQTSGRGRRGRTWFSPPGAGLYVSVVLAPGSADGDDRATPLLTLAAGVALAEAVERWTGLRPAIKWPNDLLVGRRKLAGILAEGVTGTARSMQVVLGYGINVGPMAYPPDLADKATSLETELGRPIDRAGLFAETLAALAARYGDLIAGRYDAILDAWRARAPGARGARVAWDGPAARQSGITAGIDERGALLVRVGDTIERLVAGEVTWL